MIFNHSKPIDVLYVMSGHLITLILSDIKKRTSLGGIKFISTSFSRRGVYGMDNMCRFVLMKYYGLMFGSMYVNNKFML